MNEQTKEILENLINSLEGMLESYHLTIGNLPPGPAKSAVTGYFQQEPKRAVEVLNEARKALDAE